MTDAALSLVPDDDPPGLYVSDAEIAARLGFGLKKGYQVIHAIERGIPNMRPYPRKDPLFGGRRYWPAVKQWHDDYHRVGNRTTQPAPEQYRGEENLDATPSRQTRLPGNARRRMAQA